MKIAKLTKKQVTSIPCPICGVPAEHRCLYQAGGLRFEPHMGRKIAVAEGIERESIPRRRAR